MQEIKELYLKCMQDQTKACIEIDTNIYRYIKNKEFKQILESEGVDYL